MRDQSTAWRWWRFLVLVLVCSATGTFAQTNRFFYDNLGRLAVVLDTNGTAAAFYDYDAVGNLTGIRRENVGPVNLFMFSPLAASGNTTLTLQGTGFSTSPVLNTVIFCNTITAQVVAASATQLKVLAPTNAVNCIVTVISPSGTASNLTPFTAGVRVVVSPAAVTLSGGFQQQFTATVSGSTNQNVTWTLNGWVPAGTNSALGLLTAAGLYTAPTNPPPAGLVTVWARSVQDPDLVAAGTAAVTVFSARGPISSPTVSAQPGVPDVIGPVYSATVSAGPSP